MRPTLYLSSALLLAATLPATAQVAAPADEAGLVRLYRCVGTGGSVALQDTPCQAGHVQQVIERQRPRDPPPVPVTTGPAPVAPASEPVVVTRTVTVTAPEPLYDCITPEGERYQADNGDGNPRWVSAVVPVWVPAPPGGHRPPPARPPSGTPRPPPSSPPGSPAAPPGGLWTGVPAGQWVRDSCQRLTRQEACERLSAQRWELVGRYNSALQGERAELVSDQRRLEERLERMQCRW